MRAIRRTALALAVLGLAGATSFATFLFAEELAWQDDLEAAKRLAAQSNRLVVLHFWAPWCGPCMRLERHVFNQPGVGAALERDYVPVKLNYDQYPALARQYGVEVLPTDVIITPQGQLVRRMQSPPTAGEYVGRLAQVAASVSVRTPPPERYAQVQPAQQAASAPFAPAYGAPRPSQQAPVTAGQPSEAEPLPRYAKNYAGQRPTTSWSQAPAEAVLPPEGSGAEPAPDAYAQAPAGRPTGLEQSYVAVDDALPEPPQHSVPANGRISTGRYVGVTPRDDQVARTTPQPGLQTDQRPPQGLQVGAPRQASIEPRPQFPQPLAPASVQVSPAAGAPLQPAVQPQQSAASGGPRESHPPLGLDGYCPVHLVEKQQWMKGDPKWGVIHRGRTYLFTTKSCQEQFWKDPERYSPVMAGLDPVLAKEQGLSVPGLRQHGVFYGTRVVLFASEQTRQKFELAPARYVAP